MVRTFRYFRFWPFGWVWVAYRGIEFRHNTKIQQASSEAAAILLLLESEKNLNLETVVDR